MPLVTAALHPPAAAIAEVHATDKLRTNDLRALRGIKLHKDELHSSKQQGAIALKAHVVSVCFEYFSCFIDMLQRFRMNVAKVDRDVAYVAMVVHLCWKHLFLMFYLFFQMYIASVFI
jgi:hypothetical protein